MKIVLAIDSFKGSISGTEAGNAAALGIKDVYPDAECIICPVADGGEGTTEAIVEGTGGEYRKATVSDPLGRPTEAVWGLLPSGGAVIEMSAAAGITLVNDSERDPLASDTYGVGELILAALDAGARDFIIGIGGSATNDGGVGMLRALGCRFLDKRGKDICRGAGGLSSLCKIDISKMDKRIAECSFAVASDVKNPLTGPMGATYVYGPQKGVGEELRPVLDGYLSEYARLTREVIPSADGNMPGAGAAGGLGFALVSYLGASLCSGGELVMKLNGLEAKIAGADFVITGEGRMDEQSAMGKLPCCVAALAKRCGKPVIALAGSVLDGAEALSACGIDAVLSVLRRPMSLSDAMNKNNAAENMRATARQMFGLIKAVEAKLLDNANLNIQNG